jgi:hypothetical protein
VDFLLKNHDLEMHEVMELSKKDSIKLVKQKSKEPSTLAASMPVSLKKSGYYSIYAWGDN